MKGAQDFLALFKKKKKNSEKINKKNFQLEVRSNIKAQKEQKILRI